MFFSLGDMCVCVCVFVACIGDSPSWSRRDVYYTFAVYLEDYTYSVYFSVQLEPTEVTQEGVNTGAFLFFLYSFVPHIPENTKMATMLTGRQPLKMPPYAQY